METRCCCFCFFSNAVEGNPNLISTVLSCTGCKSRAEVASLYEGVFGVFRSYIFFVIIRMPGSGYPPPRLQTRFIAWRPLSPTLQPINYANGTNYIFFLLNTQLITKLIRFFIFDIVPGNRHIVFEQSPDHLLLALASLFLSLPFVKNYRSD